MSIHDVFIKDVKIQNYRSLEDVSITLNKGLNVIIGENGAGKSNFLKFLDRHVSGFLWQVVHARNSRRENRIPVFSVDAQYRDGKEVYTSRLFNDHKAVKSKGGHILHENTGGITRLKNGAEDDSVSISSFQLAEMEYRQFSHHGEWRSLLNVFNTALITFDIPEKIPHISVPQKLSINEKEFIVNESEEKYSTLEYTSSLFSTLESDIEQELQPIAKREKTQEVIKQIITSWFNKRKRENKYAEILKQYSPISDIRLNENINIYKTDRNTIIENIVLEFNVNNHWVPWSYLSDGSVRLFHIITEVLFSEKNIILIEEPELGIHPNQLFKLMDFLKVQSQKKQIIISTHSPISLDILSPDELDQIIIAKMTKKGTAMTHLTSEQKDKAKAYIKEVGNLSAYWLHSDLEQ